MKMFKKLMAVALAGVMALAVLTGCGSSLNEKEILAIMNDSLIGSSQEVIKEFKADSGMDAKAKAVGAIVAEKAKKEAEIEDVLKSEDVKKVVVGENDTALYELSYVKKVDYSSKYYKNNKEIFNLSNISNNAEVVNQNSDYETAKDSTVLVGFADVKLDDGIYTIVAMKIPTQKKAA